MVKLYRHSSRLLFMTIFAVFSGFILSDAKVSADNTDVIDEVSITVPESCTMSGTGMNTHNAEISNNIYTTDIGTTTLHAFCNDSGGFAIYAAGYTGSEIGGANSTKLVGSPSAIGNIDTGTATSGNTSNWAMKVTKTQDSGDTSGGNAFTIDNSFNDYHAVPSSFTKVAHKNTVTDMTASTGGVKLTTTYAAFISGTQPAGTYSGQVKYTLVHPASETPPLQPVICASGKTCYNPNAYDAVGTMGQPDIASSDNSATLLATNFSREGYGFAGWSDVYDYATNNNAHFYGPQEDITFTTGQYTGTNNGLSLYAVWVKSAGYLQNWTGCGSLASGTVTALTDQRDGETYAVAKLADDNCWIIENLRLENTATHNSDGTLAQGYGTSTTYGNFSGLADPEPLSSFGHTTANSLYSTDGNNNTININTNHNNAGCRFPRYNNTNTPTTISDRPQNPTTNSATNSTSNASMYSYGNYYTWPAAIADTSHYNTNNQSVTNTSICPSGWHLPKGGDKTNEINNEIWALVVTSINSGVTPANYNSETKPHYTGTAEASPIANSLRAYPNNFVYSGFITQRATISSRGSYGFYWTSTAVSANNESNAYVFAISKEEIAPGTDTTMKYYGFPIRCLISNL